MKNNSNAVPEKVDGKTGSTGSVHKPKEVNPPRKIGSRVHRRRWEKNSFRATLKGSLTRQIAYDRDGKPVEALAQLHDSLIGRIDLGNVLEALSVDLLVADYGRLSKAIHHEECFLNRPDWQFGPENLSVLSRYIASTRRNLDQSVKMLRELETEAAEALEAELESSVTDVGETDAAASESSSSPASAASHQTDEAESGVQSAASTIDASSSEQPAPAKAVLGGEAQSNANDNGAVDSAPPTKTDQGAEQPVAAESKPAAEGAEQTGAKSEADTPQAA